MRDIPRLQAMNQVGLIRDDTGVPPNDQHGQYTNCPCVFKVKETERITDHVKLFQGCKPHYSLEESRKLNFPEQFDIRKMFRMYQMLYPEDKCSYESYRRIFSDGFSFACGYQHCISNSHAMGDFDATNFSEEHCQDSNDYQCVGDVNPGALDSTELIKDTPGRQDINQLGPNTDDSGVMGSDEDRKDIIGDSVDAKTASGFGEEADSILPNMTIDKEEPEDCPGSPVVKAEVDTTTDTVVSSSATPPHPGPPGPVTDTPANSSVSLPIEAAAHFSDLLVLQNSVVKGLPAAQKMGMIKPRRKRKREERKASRNLGLSYISESQHFVPERRKLGQRCEGTFCKIRKLSCSLFSESQRMRILNAFWDLGDLQQQRSWVSLHVQTAHPKRRSVHHRSKKQRTMFYNLPTDKGQMMPVCLVMFLNTLSISRRFIRTVVSKMGKNGVLEGEMRGGRPPAQKEIDALKRMSIEQHINEFPRIESSATCEYLSPDLTISKMHEMYRAGPGQEVPASLEMYRKVFKEKHLKFLMPKKDT